MDFDFDLDVDSEVETDAGVSMGLVKGGLTFLSVGSWVIRILLLSSANPVVAIVSGAAAGAVAVWIMSKMLQFMLRQEENVNWSVEDTLLRPGQVYLRIPAAGEGIVKVNVKGGMRELKARSADGNDLPTATPIIVDNLTPEGVLLVRVSD